MLNNSNSVVFEDINDKFCYGDYNGFKIIIMKKNGYINATKMCQDIGEQTGATKQYRDWKVNKTTQTLITEVSNAIGIAKEKLFICITGGQLRNICGTYVHPKLIMHIAMWVSPLFAIKIEQFIDEWRKLDANNENQYWKALAEAKASTNDMIEGKIRDKLCNELKGQTEVKTPQGFIDVLTDKYVIEVKHISEWKHALGQILAYGISYPNHQKVIHLYGDIADEDIIRDVCRKYDVTAMFEKIEE